MKKMFGVMCNLHSKLLTKNEEGATMVEYGLLVALIAVVCVTTVKLVGTDLSALFQTVASNVAAAT